LFYTASGRPVFGNEGITPDIFLNPCSKQLVSLAHFAAIDKISRVPIVRNRAGVTYQNIQSPQNDRNNHAALKIAIHDFDQAQLLLLNKSWATAILRSY
jgi:hypothetical protein